ncbi:MAG: ATP-binding cassette domain-containing protein [Clostridia bacterium]|nr:ATP-binding cassette domain-containing protein [Clostridia bacterium]
MESFKVENLSFTYPGRRDKALDSINFTVNPGEFVLFCGKSGCGKTTLLRLLKSSLAPFGEISGNIYFNGKLLQEYDAQEQAAGIGFVMQNPDNQIATDKVWHELAFGLESLGVKTPEIRTRVSEMASFFGIQTWFYKKVTELSGGQKQLLNLASVMVMQPSVLILDEPTSQLDPIAAAEFLKTLEKINRELGTTVILIEHRLEDAFPIADRVIVIDEGKIIADETPNEVGKILKNINHDMYLALPTPMRVYGDVPNSLDCPLTVREGRCWLEEYSKNNKLNPDVIPKDNLQDESRAAEIEVKDAWFRYEKETPDIVKGFNLSVQKGELLCVVGGNGTGKTTALSLISGLHTPYRGDVLIKGQKISKIHNLYKGVLGVLPQNPQSVFVKKTVYLDLMEILAEKKITKEEKERKLQNMSMLCRIEDLLGSHPYDLSGGEQQRAALAKVLLMEPEILLLDEPTKGMDAHFKEEFADVLADLKANGVTIIMVSHDIEFCAEYADRCALVFDGSITSVGTPREFFRGKNFYTTAANRMARTCLSDAVLAEDIISACGGRMQKKEKTPHHIEICKHETPIKSPEKRIKKLTPARAIVGSIFALLFVLTALSFLMGADMLGFAKVSFVDSDILKISAVIEFAVACLCFFPQRDIGLEVVQVPKSDRHLTKRTLWAAFLILLLIPLTIYVGAFLFGDRKYYFTSLLIILETMIPFCMVFESRKPRARELVVISVLCGIAVAGRAAFFMLPQFKPVVALVIIAGVCFGGETGFLVGAVTGFVSNFFFGQGPWTPWQMFAFGIVGFIAGILFRKGVLRKTKASLCVFGFLATLVIYGGLMNLASVIMWQNKIFPETIATAYVMGIPFDLIHAISTAFFLWVISEPMIDKLERIKIKYGLVEK